MPYDAIASDVVEKAYLDYKKNPGMCDVRAVKSGQWQYQVDFLNNKQTVRDLLLRSHPFPLLHSSFLHHVTNFSFVRSFDPTEHPAREPHREVHSSHSAVKTGSERGKRKRRRIGLYIGGCSFLIISKEKDKHQKR
jgi:hypothetical protein